MLIENYLNKIQTQQEQLIMALSVAGLFMSAYRLYKDYLTRAARACADLPHKEKTLCILRYKITGKSRELAQLKRNIGKCSTTKDPKKCTERVQQKIDKVQDQLNYFKERYRKLQTGS